MASRKSSSRLPAVSFACIDKPVTLPPGRERLSTRPLPIGSIARAKTMGMTAVACFNVGTAPPYVTMTSTFCRTNSAVISATRSGRPSDQRYSIPMVRPSIRPSCLSRSSKAAVYALHSEASGPKTPMVGIGACCARAASGHANGMPLSANMNCRRPMSSAICLVPMGSCTLQGGEGYHASNWRSVAYFTVRSCRSA